MAILCQAKMKEKTYVFNEKKNAIDQGILATSKTLPVNNVPFWITLMVCSPHADHTAETVITSFTFQEIKQNSETAHERVDWFIEGIFTRSYTIF